jgi:hypothetical protein
MRRPRASALPLRFSARARMVLNAITAEIPDLQAVSD